MSSFEKIGLYGKGVADAVKARADTQKAAQHAAKSFSKEKAYNCTVQPIPKTPETPTGSSQT